MIYKTRRIRREVLKRQVDARVVDAARFADSLVRDLSRETAKPVPEVCITTALRTRAEQLTINQRRKDRADPGSWAETLDLRWESLHEKGGALDVRIRDWPGGLAREVARLMEEKFPEIQVIVESDHLHVELRVCTRAENGWGLTADIQMAVRWRSAA